MSEVSIRPARRDDLPAILDIFARDVDGGHLESRSPAALEVYQAAFERIAATGCNFLFVAELGGRVVGTFQLTLIPGLIGHGRIRAKVESVHVHADLRGRRIGERMMRFAMDEARARGAGLMELTSNKRRPDAHRFYERLGFAKSHEGFKLDL